MKRTFAVLAFSFLFTGCGNSSVDSSNPALLGTTHPTSGGVGVLIIHNFTLGGAPTRMTIDGAPMRNCAAFTPCDLPPLSTEQTFGTGVVPGHYTIGLEGSAEAAVDIVDGVTTSLVFYGPPAQRSVLARNLAPQPQSATTITQDFAQFTSPDQPVEIAAVDAQGNNRTSLGQFEYGKLRTVTYPKGSLITTASVAGDLDVTHGQENFDTVPVAIYWPVANGYTSDEIFSKWPSSPSSL